MKANEISISSKHFFTCENYSYFTMRMWAMQHILRIRDGPIWPRNRRIIFLPQSLFVEFDISFNFSPSIILSTLLSASLTVPFVASNKRITVFSVCWSNSLAYSTPYGVLNTEGKRKVPLIINNSYSYIHIAAHVLGHMSCNVNVRLRFGFVADLRASFR